MENKISEWLRTSGYEETITRIRHNYGLLYSESKEIVDSHLVAHPEAEVYEVKPWSLVFLSTLVSVAIAAALIVIITSLHP